MLVSGSPARNWGGNCRVRLWNRRPLALNLLIRRPRPGVHPSSESAFLRLGGVVSGRRHCPECGGVLLVWLPEWLPAPALSDRLAVMRYGRERLIPAALGQEIFDGLTFVGMVGRACGPRAPGLQSGGRRPMERVVGDLFRGMSRRTLS